MKVLWTERAITDLEAIWNHVAEDSPENARQLVKKLFEAVDPLERFPRMGRYVPEDKTSSARELIIGSYRLIYEVGSEKVDVLGVVHSSRDLSAGFPPWEGPEE